MDKHYDPKAIEQKWYAWWEKNGFFHDEVASGGEPYVVVIPPPNVTGILHMGHALNESMQDILVRWNRMRGKNTIWIPGTDHAGIATQNVVERALRKEGTNRRELGREKFVERVWQWREQYGGIIQRQQRALGVSCDWQRERFTMDEGLSRAVEEVFCRLYDEGLIYKGNYIVNWCPRCQTALSDEESEHVDEDGHFWYIRYTVEGDPSRWLTVATTRPETLMGDTAVAVNPKDERYKDLIGKNVILPLMNRAIPIIADPYVDLEFGTGALKITPAHDPNDFLVGQRHKLPTIDVMNDDATMNANAGKYEGLDRFECRKQVVADLEAAGLLEKIEPLKHAVGHCYRCQTAVEPRLSKQWFVKMKPLAELAIEAVRSGEVEFAPKRWEKVYFEWMENIRDWCISRQIWWGHQIPVYTCSACGAEWAERGGAKVCPKCGRGAEFITRDSDVLDTWFSSWLWPFSTLGWPDRTEDLGFYYPTSDLVTAADIIFFWVARMIMAGCKFMGKAPFKRVYIHGIVRDGQGRKMSKSLGNSLDPLEIIDKTSADALRFSMMMVAATGQDVLVDMKSFEIGRNFGTKLWNAARFMSMLAENVGGAQSLCPAELSDDDAHLFARLDATIATVDAALEKARFQDAARAIYDFVWSDFCDWYLEYAKIEQSAARVAVMREAFGAALKMLHPFMPFVTEELWHEMKYCGENESIMRAPWPKCREQAPSAEAADYVEAKHELISAGRAMRSDYGIAPSKAIKYVFVPNDARAAEKLRRDSVTVGKLLRAETFQIAESAPHGAPGTTVKLGTIYLPLEGLIDIPAELARIAAELEKNRGFLKGVDAKLGNAGFVERAPANVVEQQRVRKGELETEIARLEKLATILKGI